MPFRSRNVVRISASNAAFAGTVRITGGRNITVGSDASGVVLSGANTQAFSGGISNLGNTAGSTGVTGTRVVFVASQNISASQSTDANGATITLNAQTGAGQFSLGVSNLGNTAGSTGISGSRVVLAGLGHLTLSQSTDANGATISISEPVETVPFWTHNPDAFYSSSTSAHVDTSVSIMRLEVPAAVSFSRIDFPVSVSLATSATAATAAMNLSATMVLYTRTAQTLNPFVGLLSTTTYTWASNSGVYSSLTGPRVLSFNIATVIGPGEYYAAVALSTASNSSIGTATTALRGTISPILGTSYSVLPFQDMSAATAATSNAVRYGQGMYNASISATNQTLSASGITMTGATAFRANGILIFRNS